MDKTGHLYIPNIAIFKLVHVLGDIMDDAVSLRPVPYDAILRHDRALTHCLDSLPEELKLDEYRTARNLASHEITECRTAVQSVVIRLCLYQVRFTLHRPYASGAVGKNPSARTSQSLETAVAAADKVISMVAQTHPDLVANHTLCTYCSASD